jgi:hypothetical protein
VNGKQQLPVRFAHPDKQVVRATRKGIAKGKPFGDIKHPMRESHLSDIRPPYTDPRGEILNLLDLPIGSVSLITSVTGAVRANHYHKTDWHYCYMQKGSMDYYFRPVGAKTPAKYIRVEEGRRSTRWSLRRTRRCGVLPAIPERRRTMNRIRCAWIPSCLPVPQYERPDRAGEGDMPVVSIEEAAISFWPGADAAGE